MTGESNFLYVSWCAFFAVALALLLCYYHKSSFLRDLPHYFYAAHYFTNCREFAPIEDIKLRMRSPRGNRRRTVTIVFIRHGESIWNSCFDRIHPVSLFRAFRFACQESARIILSVIPRAFLDSPLSAHGRQQATAAGAQLEHLGFHHSHSYLLLSSNLQRALETAQYSFTALNPVNHQPIWIHSDLQEISRNIDTFSTLRLPQPHATNRKVLGFDPFGFLSYAGGWDMKYHAGNKGIEEPGWARVRRFAYWALSCDQPREVVYIAGHSAWLKMLLRLFIPLKEQRKVCWTERKLSNGGVLVFELVSQEKDGSVWIPPRSVRACSVGRTE